MEEEVLVFPSSVLDELGGLNGFSGDLDRYLPAVLEPANLSYLPRSRAEDDPSFKQLIPYAVLTSGDSVFCYARSKKGGESRLHERLSLGVGGHICRADGSAGVEAYQAGFLRELAEEVAIQADYELTTVGILHDPTTPVGLVHVGIVHLLKLSSPSVRAVDPSLAEGLFRPIASLHQHQGQFETWSQLVIDHLWNKQT